MAKMGYVAGVGLGKGGEGRVEPVEVLILPEGITRFGFFSFVFCHFRYG
jgi:hypothetical protein